MKINRTRKRILHKYKYLRFRKSLIEKMSEMLSNEIDNTIIRGYDGMKNREVRKEKKNVYPEDLEDTDSEFLEIIEKYMKGELHEKE